MDRSPTGPRSLLRLTICLTLALLLMAGYSGVAGAVRYQRESYATFQQQLNSGQIRSATFNKKAHTLHLLLINGHYALISYPSHEEPQLAALLQAKGVAVTVEKKKKAAKPVHHTLRYIAGGIAVVVIAVVVGVLLFDRRRKLGEAAPGERTAAPPAQSSTDPE